MDRTCKHTFRPGCEDLEGRQLLSTFVARPIFPILTPIHPLPILPLPPISVPIDGGSVGVPASG
jgi:hypothetical protein